VLIDFKQIPSNSIKQKSKVHPQESDIIDKRDNREARRCGAKRSVGE